jgi:E3 SUMO-protein ligase PIAS1
MAPARNLFSPHRLVFADSPFYRIVKQLTDPVECKARETTRDTARVTLVLPRDLAYTLQQDETQRVMIFCTAETIAGSNKSDISFPHQVELKCNEQEIKANLRGIKNKPGSTRPVDITSLLRKKAPEFKNVIEMVYALTTKVIPFPSCPALYYVSDV